ncbi:hypothetical protein NTH44_003116 [Vibrio metoecus]
MGSWGVLMPFAISNSTGAIVSIADEINVKRGNYCDCRCLSCGTPVTARRGDVYQWHFSHRTDENTTATDCKYSPVTAIALILRQMLPKLSGLVIENVVLNEIRWEIDVRKAGTTVDLSGIDDALGIAVAIEVPFANGVGLDIDTLAPYYDIILRIDTAKFAESIFTVEPIDPIAAIDYLTPDYIFNILINNWSLWVETVLYPQPPQIKPEEPICRCCNSNIADRAKGILCSCCIYQQVGTKFINLTEMISHYKSMD